MLIFIYALIALMSFSAAYWIYTSYARVKKINAELEKRLRQRTAELEAALKEVQSANRELETFSHAVSHDLKAPLFTINGFVGALLEDYGPRLDEDAQHYLQSVKKSSRDMGTLLDDLLVYGRLGREAYYSPRLIQMSDLVSSVLEEVRALDPNRQVQTVTKTLIPAMGSFSMIRQVFRNLISNAFKFTKLKEKAVIEVGSEEKPDEIVYYVRDNGAGFDMTYAEKIFGVFQRLHSAEEYEGHGLGLSIVERIIHRHGGRVWAEGRIGEGAIFYFTLPKTLPSS